jgi:hypothetical protein
MPLKMSFSLSNGLGTGILSYSCRRNCISKSKCKSKVKESAGTFCLDHTVLADSNAVIDARERLLLLPLGILKMMIF